MVWWGKLSMLQKIRAATHVSTRSDLQIGFSTYPSDLTEPLSLLFRFEHKFPIFSSLLLLPPTLWKGKQRWRRIPSQALCSPLSPQLALIHKTFPCFNKHLVSLLCKWALSSKNNDADNNNSKLLVAAVATSLVLVASILQTKTAYISLFNPFISSKQSVIIFNVHFLQR